MTPFLVKNIVFFLQALRKEPVKEVFNELLETQSWSAEKLQKLQFDRLVTLLKYAKENSPYYKEKFKNIDISDFKSIDDISVLPTISKKDIQENANKMFINNSYAFTVASTSGSSGDPLLLKRDNRSWAYLHANMYRLHTWHNLPVAAKYANVMGISTKTSKHIAAFFKKIIFNRINLVAVDMSDSALLNFTAKVSRFKPSYIYGYPSAIADYAQYIKKNNFQDKVASISHIICHGEELEERYADQIKQGLNARIVNQYGCAETGMIGIECEHGSLHIPAESVVVENLNGELVITDLFNYVTPLIRYTIGDIGDVSSETCACGRNLPVIKNLEGKRRTIITTPDGRKVHTVFFNSLFKDLVSSGFNIEKYQIIQKSKDFFYIDIKSSDTLSDKIKSIIDSKIKEKFGMKVTFEPRKVEQIKKYSSGKLATFIKDFE
jgi:phenylacetate-coenzyme A ligase PaaK-like adenylate-forming protein